MSVTSASAFGLLLGRLIELFGWLAGLVGVLSLSSLLSLSVFLVCGASRCVCVLCVYVLVCLCVCLLLFSICVVFLCVIVCFVLLWFVFA